MYRCLASIQQRTTDSCNGLQEYFVSSIAPLSRYFWASYSRQDRRSIHVDRSECKRSSSDRRRRSSRHIASAHNVGGEFLKLSCLGLADRPSLLRGQFGLLSTGLVPMQLRSSTTTTTTTTTTEYVALTLKGHLVSACTQTTVLRVLSDFWKRKVDVQGGPTAASPALQSLNLVTATSGGDGCADGLDSIKIFYPLDTPPEILQAPQSPFSSLVSWQNSFYFNLIVVVELYSALVGIYTTLGKRRALCTLLYLFSFHKGPAPWILSIGHLDALGSWRDGSRAPLPPRDGKAFS